MTVKKKKSYFYITKNTDLQKDQKRDCMFCGEYYDAEDMYIFHIVEDEYRTWYGMCLNCSPDGLEALKDEITMMHEIKYKL